MKTFLEASGLGSSLRGMRNWYRQWVQVREIRYRALAEILDDIEKRGSADLSTADVPTRAQRCIGDRVCRAGDAHC